MIMKKTRWLVALVLLSACASNEVHVSTYDNVAVEYGEELDNSKLFDASTSDEDIEVKEVEGFDQRLIGEQKVMVTFQSTEEATKTVDLIINVKDTKAPIITIDKDEIEIIEGEAYQPKTNVLSVKDPVDGDILYNESSIDLDGYYIDTKDFDYSKVGEYEVVVKAIDKNGLHSENKFTIKVKEKEVISIPSSTDHSSGGQGSNPTPNVSDNASLNSGSSHNEVPSNPAPSPTPEPEKPQTCTIPYPSNMIGNSGQVFKTMDEANVWADAYIDNQSFPWRYNGWYVTSLLDECTKEDMYTVDFY